VGAGVEAGGGGVEGGGSRVLRGALHCCWCSCCSFCANDLVGDDGGFATSLFIGSTAEAAAACGR
jgi:hypothetical protein